MTRNLKALGLALVAVLAMAALAASAAQATRLKTLQATARLTVESVFHSESAGTQQVYTTSSGAQIRCNTVSGSATVLNNATSMTLESIAYGGCSAKVGASTLPVTMDTTGCDYLLHTNASGHNVLDLVCPVGVTGPDITIFTDAAHTMLLCTLTISAFTEHEGISYQNVAGSPDDIKIIVNEIEAPVKRHGSILCGSPTSAKLTGTITVRAYKDGLSHTPENQIGVTVE